MAIQLATVEDIAQRTNVSLNSGESEVFESVLYAATTMMEMVLQTELERTLVADSYLIRDPVSSGTSIRLWTSRQFLKKDTVQIYVSEYGTKVNRNTMSPLGEDSTYIDLRKGSIDILDYVNTTNAFIDVVYTAGFTSGDPAIPAWMKEAAISAGVWLHRMQAVRHGKKFDTVELDRELYRIMRAQVSTQLFSQYSGYFPDNSTVTE